MSLAKLGTSASSSLRLVARPFVSSWDALAELGGEASIGARSIRSMSDTGEIRSKLLLLTERGIVDEVRVGCFQFEVMISA